MLARKTATESRMVGMPSVWQARFTRMLVAGGVLGDPLLVGAVAQHGGGSYNGGGVFARTRGTVEASAFRVVAS